jgi:hypothetical protein
LGPRLSGERVYKPHPERPPRQQIYRFLGDKALGLLRLPPKDAAAQGLILDPTRQVVAAAAKIRCFAQPSFAIAEQIVNRALRQVSLYMTNLHPPGVKVGLTVLGTRDQVLNVVEQTLTPETRIIVGHSLGSVVAYEVCHRLTRPLSLLLTMGSPLGLDTIVYQRTVPQPPHFPSAVEWWVNTADRDDIVAADPILVDRFPPPRGKQLTDHEVANRLSAHGATDYLKQPEVVYPLALVLGRAPSASGSPAFS